MKDRFNREIEFDGKVYHCEGIEVATDTPEAALAVFDAMAPTDWIEEKEGAANDPSQATGDTL